MKTGGAILAGLLAGVLVAAGVLAAFVFVGPDPIGLRPTPSPTVAATASPSASAGPSATASPSASAGPSATASPSASAGPSASAAPSSSLAPSASASAGAPIGSDAGQTGFHIGEPAPTLIVAQLGGGTIDLSTPRGEPVWVNFMQTTCPECGPE